MVRTHLFVVASPAGRKEPSHTVGRWPGVELLPGRADMESGPYGSRQNLYANPGTKNRVQAMTTSATMMPTMQRKSSLVNFNCFSRVRPSPPW